MIERGPPITADLDGAICDGRHYMRIRIYYEDTDFQNWYITQITCASWNGAERTIYACSGPITAPCLKKRGAKHPALRSSCALMTIDFQTGIYGRRVGNHHNANRSEARVDYAIATMQTRRRPPGRPRARRVVSGGRHSASEAAATCHWVPDCQSAPRALDPSVSFCRLRSSGPDFRLTLTGHLSRAGVIFLRARLRGYREGRQDRLGRHLTKWRRSHHHGAYRTRRAADGRENQPSLCSHDKIHLNDGRRL